MVIQIAAVSATVYYPALPVNFSRDANLAFAVLRRAYAEQRVVERVQGRITSEPIAKFPISFSLSTR